MNVFGEAASVLARPNSVEAASVKCKAKWRSVNVVLEDVPHGKGTRDIGLGSFLSGLLYRNLGAVNSDHSEVLLREPDGVVASSASDFQSLAGSNRRGGHGLNQVEVRLSNVPRCGAFFICLPEMIFDAHIGFILGPDRHRSEEHTSELQSLRHLV